MVYKLKYGYSRITIRKLDLNTRHRFKFRAGRSKIALIYRLDILHNTYILIIRRKAFIAHIEDIAYGYL